MTTLRGPARTGNRTAAFTLVALAPLIAELAFGSTPLRLAWLVLLWLPIYGAGILLVRESIRRTGRGWPSIVLLGVVYELAEDGIGLQALSSPHLYGAADWGARIFGLNLPYWEANVLYHVIFSAVIPILLADLLFPSHRDVPYLKKTGLVITALVAVFGVWVLRVSVPPSQDPGYAAPLPVVLGCLVVMSVLTVIALAVLPARGPTARTQNRVPPLWGLCVLGAVGATLLLALTFPFGGAHQPAFTHGWWVLVPMSAAAALALVAYRLIRRWARSTTWTSSHALALAGGALVAHSLAGTTNSSTTFDRVGLIVIAALTAALSLRLGHQLRHPAGMETDPARSN
ncbi:MAG: hypothetical protein ABIQ18_02250 [Umezawaea sp.]